jgi:hypothetical protein
VTIFSIIFVISSVAMFVWVFRRGSSHARGLIVIPGAINTAVLLWLIAGIIKDILGRFGA